MAINTRIGPVFDDSELRQRQFVVEFLLCPALLGGPGMRTYQHVIHNVNAGRARIYRLCR